MYFSRCLICSKIPGNWHELTYEQRGVLYTYLFVFCHLQNYYLIYMPCLTKKTPDKYPNPRQEARGISLTRQREGPRLPPMQIWSEKGHGGHGRGMQSRKLASAQYRKVNWLCCRSAIHGEDGFNIPVSLRGGRGYGFGLRLDSGRMFPAGGRVDHVSRKLPLFVLGAKCAWMVLSLAAGIYLLRVKLLCAVQTPNPGIWDLGSWKERVSW